MKYLFWLLKAAIFLLLFAFAINNRHEVTLHLLFGYALTLPIMVIVLGAFAIGAFAGMIVMLPSCWRYKRSATRAQAALAQHAAAQNIAEGAASPAASPAELGRHMTDPSITIPYSQ